MGSSVPSNKKREASCGPRRVQIRAEGVQAVEVLWTPQEEGDTLTQEELSRDYPLLKTL